jgi:hypothetical protein
MQIFGIAAVTSQWLSLAETPSRANAFEISDIRDDTTEAS